MNARLLVLALVAVTVFGYGCSSAGSSTSSSTSTSGSPRVRCLADPREGSTRPLVYLFCIESP